MRVVAVVVAASLLSACGAGGRGGPRVSDELRGRFEGDLSQWTLPLDSYRPDLELAERRHSFAEGLLLRECLAERGFPNLPLPEAPTKAGRAMNDQGRILFNVELAREHGYHRPSDLSLGLSPAQRAASEAFSAVLEATPLGAQSFDDCLADIRRDQLPLSELTNENLVDALAFAAYEEVRHGDALDAPVRRWRECMEPLGIADLPASPLRGMPPPSLSERFGLGGNSEGGPSSEEIRIAVADAECRESSGLSQELYTLEFEAQLRHVAANEEELERIRASVEADAALVKAILAEHG